ncbi:MAG: DNA topoisomerase IV subunit A, partial [Gammaproteobacteria bacterium]|nr:DNA topoisomerase IV subunit A [Gammaproteobacteria bacterium]
LTLERDEIDKTLKSKKRMISLIKKEIEEVVEEFGDKRRSRIVQRDAAQAIDPTNLVPAEPITIVLSEKGFVRAGKGYDVDPLSLSYKPGDRYMDFEYTKTNQQAVFMDSTGRTYCLGAHNLPSARGYGDPLTSKLKPPPGATFRGVLTGDEGDLFFVGSDAGYGFMVRYQEMLTRNRAGKGIVSVPKGNTALTPQWIEDSESQWLAMATDDGHLLLLPTAELMEMTKGKGIKLINLPTGKGKADTPRVKAVFVLYDDSELVIHSGNKSKTLAGAELDEYIGERGKRGSKLPRGFQTFDRIEALHVEEEEGEE